MTKIRYAFLQKRKGLIKFLLLVTEGLFINAGTFGFCTKKK
jgi:hypothetical protein